MASCPDRYRLVEDEIDKVLTQYRESTHFLFLLRTLLGHTADVLRTICTIPDHFYLDTAVGEQLTFLGERLGWPRCHCVCATTPLFGFECEGFPTEHPLTGFCDGAQTWADCGPFGAADICLTDDEMYRKFVKVRRYQMLAFYDYQSLTEAIQIFWGPTAFILDAGHGRVVIAPGRDLTAAEMAVVQLYPRVLPVAPGIESRFHFGEVSRKAGLRLRRRLGRVLRSVEPDDPLDHDGDRCARDRGRCRDHHWNADERRAVDVRDRRTPVRLRLRRRTMADFNTPFGDTGERRFPAEVESAEGHPCGPADRPLFNGLQYRVEAEIGNVISYAGIPMTNARMTQLREAIEFLISAATGGGDPSEYVLMSQARARLPIFPEVSNIDHRIVVTSPATGTVRIPGGVELVHRGIYIVTTAQQDFPTDPSKTYHLRWDVANGFRLRDLANAGYNPTALVEWNPIFDSTYDDAILARISTNSSNIATITNLANLHRWFYQVDLTGVMDSLDPGLVEEPQHRPYLQHGADADRRARSCLAAMGCADRRRPRPRPSVAVQAGRRRRHSAAYAEPLRGLPRALRRLLARRVHRPRRLQYVRVR